MNLPRPAAKRKARIEIIPLIDIMFFLLACFMLVSLQMIQMHGVKINLPAGSTGAEEKKADFVAVTVDPLGTLFWEKEPITQEQLVEKAKALIANDKEARIYVRGDKEALHGEVISTLDKLRAAGVHKVIFEIKAAKSDSTSVASTGNPGGAG